MKISSAEPLKGSTTGIAPDFTIFTSAMEIDSERENVVRMIGSSTERDLHGDTMAISALTDMAQVDPGLVIWLNHDYELPGSLFGSLLEKPELRLKDGIADLHIVSSVEMSNPNAVSTYGYIRNGTRLGCSIGCMILECEIDEENDDGYSWWPPLIITHVLPLEWSVVGIPANQRSWVENAIKGLFDRSLSSGKVNDALRLAPAMKSLWSKDFSKILKGIEDASLKKELEAIPARISKRRVEWDPHQKTFMMNQKGITVPLDRKDIPAFMAKGIEAPRKTMIGWDPAAPDGSLVVVDAEKFLRSEQGTVAETKGASGKTSWPLADEDSAWDKGAAHKRIMEWAGGDDPDWGKVKTVHFWFDDEKADTWGGYKLPFCDNDSGIKAIPKAIYSVAGAIGGARAPLDIPDEDIPAIKKKVEAYYHKLDKKAPWEDEEKEDDIEPAKEAEVNPTETATKDVLAAIEEAGERHDQQREAPLAVLDKARFESVTDPLDVQLFNALAERLGQPVITLDVSGQVQASKAFTELSAESIHEAIAKALSFGETIKAGTEFSKENKDKLQSLHDDLVNMCMSSFHPCKEMDADADGDNDGDGNDNDNDGDDKEKQLSATLIANSEIPALREDFKVLINTLKGHIDSKAVKDLQSRIDAADKRLKDIQATTKSAEERLASLQNVPLGQPTLLRRGIQNNGDIVGHGDFKALSAATMGDNERRWSLDEALGQTIVVPRTLAGGEIMNYRKWPENVGGSVKDGVRPALTSTQRTWMHPAEMLSYNDGNEAYVPCYDDPAGIEA